MFYLRARYYDPSTGQFISRDPAVASTRQPYAYGYDDPLNVTDPSGLFGWDDLKHLAGAGAGAIATGVGWAHDNFAVPVAKAGLNYAAETAGDCASRQFGRVANCSVSVLMAATLFVPGGGPVVEGFGEIKAAGTLSEDAVLPAAMKWLRSGCSEIDNGVFRSADNARQFRMTDADLVGREAPHVHFESIGPNGRTITESAKVWIR